MFACTNKFWNVENKPITILHKFLNNNSRTVAGTFITSFLQNNIKTNQLEINTDAKNFRTIAKLKEPRDLFALPKELDCPQQAPRYPTECQVNNPN